MANTGLTVSNMTFATIGNAEFFAPFQHCRACSPNRAVVSPVQKLLGREGVANDRYFQHPAKYAVARTRCTFAKVLHVESAGATHVVIPGSGSVNISDHSFGSAVLRIPSAQFPRPGSGTSAAVHTASALSRERLPQ